MRGIFAFSLLTALIASCVDLAAAETVAFTHRPLAEHQRLMTREKYSIKLELSTRLGTTVMRKDQQHLVENTEKTVTLTKIEDGKPRKARVEFGTVDQVNLLNPQKSTTSIISGRSYDVLEGVSMAYTDTEGNLPVPAEYEILKRTVTQLRRDDPLGVALHGRTLTLGEVVTLPGETVTSLIRLPATGYIVQAFTLTPRERSEKNGQQRVNCDVHIHAVAEEHGKKSTLTLTGNVTLELATARVQVLSLEGPLAVSGKAQAGAQELSFEGSGIYQAFMAVGAP